jgi:hypothetical protein
VISPEAKALISKSATNFTTRITGFSIEGISMDFQVQRPYSS